MTSAKLEQGQKLHNDIIKWSAILNEVTNHGIASKYDTIQSIQRVMSSECFNKIRDLMSDVANEKLKEIKKEFDEL